MHSFSHTTNGNKDDHNVRRSELLRERSKKETDLQILRNELHSDERDLSVLEDEIRKLEFSLSHADRDIENAKIRIRDLQQTSKYHGDAAKESATDVRELKDDLLRKRHDEAILQHEVADARQLYEEKSRARVALSDEIKHLEQELELKTHKTNIGESIVHTGGGEVAQLEITLNRLEGENKRSQSSLEDKKREAEHLKQKISRLQAEERTSTHELQQMIV